MKNAIIYLHGFNSASVNLSGVLLASKPKLTVLAEFCKENQIKLCTPNLDYRDYSQVISELTKLFAHLTENKYKTIFMGSSMGGFTSDYMAMKYHTQAIMINPAITPTDILNQFIGTIENEELSYTYQWTKAHCDQYLAYQVEVMQANALNNKTIFLDIGDELIDSLSTAKKYQNTANVYLFTGGSHSFEHMEQALPAIKKVVFEVD